MVFVQGPVICNNVAVVDGLAVVESVKAASDVYAPISDEVVEANGDLATAPETVNADPEGKGWFAKLSLSDPSQLDSRMNRADYDAYLATL